MPHRNPVGQDGCLGGSRRERRPGADSLPWNITNLPLGSQSLMGPTGTLGLPLCTRVSRGWGMTLPPATFLRGEEAWAGSPRPEGPPLAPAEEGRGLKQRTWLPDRATCKVAGGLGYAGRGWGTAGGGAPEPSWLLNPHPICIPSLSPEIRMSKPLEAEKQGLDSPSEHTGEWGREQGGRRITRGGRQGCCGGLRVWPVTTHPFPVLADTERNGPDTNHQVRRGGEGEVEVAVEGSSVGEGEGIRSCLSSLFPSPTPPCSLQNPQNKTSPFSVSPTGPSTKVSTCQSSQGQRGGLSCDGSGLAFGRRSQCQQWAQGLIPW